MKCSYLKVPNKLNVMRKAAEFLVAHLETPACLKQRIRLVLDAGINFTSFVVRVAVHGL